MCSSMPSIHECGQLTVVNERLEKKIRSLKKKNALLQLTMEETQQKHKINELLVNCKTYKEVESQTDPHLLGLLRSRPVQKKQTENIAKQPQSVANSQLLTLYNNLMKERDKNIQLNITQAEQVSMLKMKVQQLEDTIRNLRRENLQLQKSSSNTPQKPRCKSTPVSSTEFKRIKAERDKLYQEKKKLKKELSALDPKFFEEIEDIKFALEQSAKLNKKYEQCLKQMCKKFGLPYPFPERGVM